MSRSISVPAAARAAVGAVLLALAAGASAQSVYRSVGPDGKVIFSDKPPAGESVELRGGRVQPPAAKGASGATAQKPAAGHPPSAESVTRALNVLASTDNMVTGFVRACGATSPTTAKKYSDAAEGWRKRHRTLLQRRDLILNDSLSDAQLRQVVEDGKEERRKLMDPVYKSPPDSRVRWCDAKADEIVSGRLDRYQDQSIAGPLMAYQKKR